MAHKKFAQSNCPVCHSQYTVYLRDIQTRRLNRDIPIYHCLDCGSFNNAAGYLEDDDQLQRDAAWHISVQERNETWSRNFLNSVRQHHPHVKSILEIGCGTGTLLNIAKNEYKMDVVGYDTNEYAIELGRKHHPNVPLVCGFWTPQSHSEKYDLIVSISTLEHLEQPRVLFAEISEYCAKHGSEAFISVPYFEREDWPELLKEDTAQEPGTLLYLSDVHIIHFSKRGFVTMAGQLGASSVNYFPRGWHGHWVGF